MLRKEAKDSIDLIGIIAENMKRVYEKGRVRHFREQRLKLQQQAMAYSYILQNKICDVNSRMIIIMRDVNGYAVQMTKMIMIIMINNKNVDNNHNDDNCDDDDIDDDDNKNIVKVVLWWD